MPMRGGGRGFGRGGGYGRGGFGSGYGNGGLGPQGNCLCPRCGHIEPHIPGTPCRELRCPKCGSAMVREGGYHHRLIEERKSKKKGGE